MKTKQPVHLLILGIAFITFVTLSAFSSLGDPDHMYHDRGGIASSCGSPGEMGTCSRSGCHGAGASPAGLADNAGPGSLTLSSVPAMSSNQYVPGQLYNMTVTVAQTGVKRFGFACEILDNSGSTNTHVNNTAGTVTITDHIHTRTWQAFGNGRMATTHDTMGGYTLSNTYSFNFNWTAPNTGFGNVNVYLCGNATNDDSLADGGDDIYSQHIVLTEKPLTVNTITENGFNVNVYPNPASSQLTLQFNLPGNNNVNVALYSVDGKMVKQLEEGSIETDSFSKTYPVNNLAKGIYIVKINAGDTKCVKRIVIE